MDVCTHCVVSVVNSFMYTCDSGISKMMLNVSVYQ